MRKVYVIESLHLLPEFDGKSEEFIQSVITKCTGICFRGIDNILIILPGLGLAHVIAVPLRNVFDFTMVEYFIIVFAVLMIWVVLYIAFISVFVVRRIRREIRRREKDV